jgi:hypothetical protein
MYKVIFISLLLFSCNNKENLFNKSVKFDIQGTWKIDSFRVIKDQNTKIVEKFEAIKFSNKQMFLIQKKESTFKSTLVGNFKLNTKDSVLDIINSNGTKIKFKLINVDSSKLIYKHSFSGKVGNAITYLTRINDLKENDVKVN